MWKLLGLWLAHLSLKSTPASNLHQLTSCPIPCPTSTPSLSKTPFNFSITTSSSSASSISLSTNPVSLVRQLNNFLSLGTFTNESNTFFSSPSTITTRPTERWCAEWDKGLVLSGSHACLLVFVVGSTARFARSPPLPVATHSTSMEKNGPSILEIRSSLRRAG